MGQGVVQCYPYGFWLRPLSIWMVKKPENFVLRGLPKKLLHEAGVRRKSEFFIVLYVKITLISLILSLDCSKLLNKRLLG